jgi:hypothetical protein
MKFILAFTSTFLANIWVVSGKDGWSTIIEASTRIAISVCSGLFNRNPDIAGVSYTFERVEDINWLRDEIGQVKPRKIH